MGALRTVGRLLTGAVSGLLRGSGVTALKNAVAPRATKPDNRAPLPVPYTFFSGTLREIITPGSALPGANDWTCRTSQTRPRPVILVHGTAGSSATNWSTFGPLLFNEGYCVFAPTYGVMPGAVWPISELGGLADLDTVSVPEVADFVDRVLEATGAEQVDLVGHSQGTLICGLVAKFERPGRVHSVVSLAPLWNGTGGELWRHAICGLPGGRAQAKALLPPVLEGLLTGSNLLQKLWTGGTPYAPGVRYVNIVTRYDEVVLPYTSGLVPGPQATNIVVQDGCEQDHSDHVAVAASPRAADFVLAALDPATARAPRCVSLVPIFGPV